MNPSSDARADMPNWWAIEAMITSYNHVYQVVYHTRYEDCGLFGVSIYGTPPLLPTLYEFLALNTDPQAVIEAIRSYAPPAREYVLDVFHAFAAVN
ncbi:MAG: hypothetical protein ACP5QU_11785 [Anaerolineae bacterium]